MVARAAFRAAQNIPTAENFDTIVITSRGVGDLSDYKQSINAHTPLHTSDDSMLRVLVNLVKSLSIIVNLLLLKYQQQAVYFKEVPN